jgi:hypothetical protein
MAIIVLIQNDLRLLDNPALHAAAEQDYAIIPVYVPETQRGSASRWWIATSLEKFSHAIEKVHLPLLYYERKIFSRLGNWVNNGFLIHWLMETGQSMPPTGNGLQDVGLTALPTFEYLIQHYRQVNLIRKVNISENGFLSLK